MRGVVHPEVLRAARALQNAGWRLPSIYRPAFDSGGHRLGLAIDVANMVFHDGYTLNDAQKILRIAIAATGRTWASIAEDDHVHLELQPERGGRSFYGRKNSASNHQLEIVHE